jgi:uncharacterized protein (DUF1697 family)
MPTYLALFRGINVGGNHQVRMADLTALHEELGFTRVRTYIQSGNVVFNSDETDAEPLRARIEEAFARRFGFRSEVYLRSASEVEDIIEREPFHRRPDSALQWVVVTFLPSTTDATAWADVVNTYPGHEEVVLSGSVLYVYYCNGIGTSKIGNTPLGKRLKTTGTARNWNTVLKLHDLMRE